MNFLVYIYLFSVSSVSNFVSFDFFFYLTLPLFVELCFFSCLVFSLFVAGEQVTMD